MVVFGRNVSIAQQRGRFVTGIARSTGVHRQGLMRLLTLSSLGITQRGLQRAHVAVSYVIWLSFVTWRFVKMAVNVIPQPIANMVERGMKAMWRFVRRIWGGWGECAISSLGCRELRSGRNLGRQRIRGPGKRGAGFCLNGAWHQGLQKTWQNLLLIYYLS